MRNGLHIPGQSNINVQVAPSPLVGVVSLARQSGTGTELFALGGMTKLEHATIALVAQGIDPKTALQTAKETLAMLDAEQYGGEGHAPAAR